MSPPKFLEAPPEHSPSRLACSVEAWLRLEGASSISTSSCDSSSPERLTLGGEGEGNTIKGCKGGTPIFGGFPDI